VPPSNPARRDALTDAAIEIVAGDGLHGLSHRAVDERAGVPPGTTSNYFRSRDTLVEAAMRRIVELHFALIDEVRTRYRVQGEEDGGGLTRQGLIDMLGTVVDQALTRFRPRYLAMFELALEGTRRPELRQVFAAVADESMKLTQAAHQGDAGLTAEADVQLLNAFYNGVLFTYLVMPRSMGERRPGELTRSVLDLVIRPVAPPSPTRETGARGPWS
jgi:DNA-binding transcriptional regulator YbjK